MGSLRDRGDIPRGACDFREVTRRTRRAGWAIGISAFVLGGAFVACTETPPTFDEKKPGKGGTQPEGNGVAIDEAAACQKLADAHAAASSSLGCEGAEFECPEAIRPAGACDTYSYDEGSVDACVAVIEAYDACSDFDEQPCIVTAMPVDGECIVPGTGGSGAGGEGGGGGAGGLGGSN